MHWVHATAFLILLGSGLCLYLPSLAEVVSRRPLVKGIHIYTAVAWAIALVLIALVGDRRSLARTAREIDRFDADDREWLRRWHAPQGRLNAGQKLNAAITAGRRHAAQGRLNAGQKLNAAITAAFALLFVVSGFFLWYGERDTRFRLPSALLVHDWLMYVSFVLFIGHLFLAVIYPKTRHALNGITRGWVDEDWALQHHRKWVEQRRSAGDVDDLGRVLD